MRIALASDHAGFSLKREIEAVLQGQGLETRDFGTHDEEACDLSDFVYPAAPPADGHPVSRAATA